MNMRPGDQESSWWLAGPVIAVAGAAEWLRSSSPWWLAVTAFAGAVAWAGLRGATRWRRAAVVVPIAALTLALASTQWRLHYLATRWDEEMVHRVDRAAAELRTRLDAISASILPLTERIAAMEPPDRASGFQDLADVVGPDDPSIAVAIMEPTGGAWAWAGRHRLLPQPVGPGVATRVTPLYAVLEARKPRADGRVAVVSVLLWAHPAVIDDRQSIAGRVRWSDGVAVSVLGPNGVATEARTVSLPNPTAPRGQSTKSHGPPMLRLSIAGPEQEAALDSARRTGVWLVGWLAITVLAGAGLACRRAVHRYVLLATLLWAAVHAPLGDAIGLGALFSPATYFRPLLGPLSSSAGVLVLCGASASLLAISLWRRRFPRRWYGVAAAVLLLLGAPYAVSSLGRGITPPAQGVSIGLWLTWQFAVALAVCAVMVTAAALFRGHDDAPEARWRLPLAVGIGFVAAVVGLYVWLPRGGWPEWYTFLWTPALLLAAMPAKRWAAIAGIALVAGSAAALVTWGTAIEGRLEVARRDIDRLGPEPDPLAVPLLERFATEARAAGAPATATDLYILWHESRAGLAGYPVKLGVWAGDGDATAVASLALDNLALPDSLLATVARSLSPAQRSTIFSVLRVPGTYYVLVLRYPGGELLTAAIGPRTELIGPSTLGRLLRPPRRTESLYTLALGEPSFAIPVDAGFEWRRDGWMLRGERTLTFPDGPRRLSAAIDLRGPAPLLVRGVLVVLLDAATLALLWLVAELIAGERIKWPAWRRVVRSFRVRLAFALAGFFVVPALGFSAWNFARLGQDARHTSDLLTAQQLRDVGTAGAELTRVPADQLVSGLKDLGRHAGAELALFSGSRLVATSASVLADLGPLSPLLDTDVYQVLVLGGEPETAREGGLPGWPGRIGYRTIRPGPPGGTAVLALPTVPTSGALQTERIDLALVLLLAALAGLGAALFGARFASSALSRPVADLRRAALSLGQGAPSAPFSPDQPPEFEPVFGAFERMAADIRATQAELDAARRRTAAVLGTVATGVVALDARGRVLLANPAARELLRADLDEGVDFEAALEHRWVRLAGLARQSLEDAADRVASAELDAGGRRFSVRIAPLEPELSGIVLAIADVTGVAEAERVLAWGEMARQVAHEIKNPLTPLRLGVQHLRRVIRDRHPQAEDVAEQTVARILGEIDRLDGIARAFSRFAAPAAVTGGSPLDRVELASVASDVLQLYRLAPDSTTYHLEVAGNPTALARADELREVLVNLVENARAASAQHIEIRIADREIAVVDDGRGIPAALLPRVFEPRFSTTTRGSGLGLAIVRRLVDGWGGTVGATSEEGKGTVVTIRFADWGDR